MNIDDPGPAPLTVPEALEAIGNLAGLERRADPGVLLRVLLEHMIVSTETGTGPSSPAALEECLLLLVGAGLCPLRVSTQRRSGPVGPCPFHLSWVTTPSSWALLRNTRSPGHFIHRG